MCLNNLSLWYADIVLMIKGREMNGHIELKRRTDTRITKTSFIRIEYAAVQHTNLLDLMAKMVSFFSDYIYHALAYLDVRFFNYLINIEYA